MMSMIIDNIYCDRDLAQVSVKTHAAAAVLEFLRRIDVHFIGLEIPQPKRVKSITMVPFNRFSLCLCELSQLCSSGMANC